MRSSIFISIALGACFFCFIGRTTTSEQFNFLDCLWVNTKYINCMEFKLPCECDSEIKSFVFIKFSKRLTKDTYRAFGQFSEDMEPSVLIIKKEKKNQFKVTLTDSTNIKGYIYFSGKQMIFRDVSKRKMIFERQLISGDYEDEFCLNNLNLTNRALNRKGYKNLESILHADSLELCCDKWSGQGNFLYNKKNSWSLEIKNDTMFIYELSNKSITAPPIFDKTVYKMIKW